MSKKRKSFQGFERDEESDGNAPAENFKDDGGKKRFVWPDALHKDFIAAVFDIGMIFLLAT